jgi:uncharacterized membrane protein
VVSHKRHLVKAVTWRIVASVTTVLMALFFGLPMVAVSSLFLADLVIKFVMYYLHERVWYTHVKYGVNDE